MLRTAALIAALCATSPVIAAGSLEGRTVTLNVETWDNPARPLLISNGRTVTVGSGVEFAMGPEGWTHGIDVVPVEVEIGRDRIEFSYGAGTGEFWKAAFNGYVLRFKGDCALFSGARVNKAESTIRIRQTDVRIEPQAIFVNLSGHSYGPDKRLVIDLKVEECPVS